MLFSVSGTGCDGEPATVVLVTVDARPTVQTANALDVVVSHEGDTERALFFLDSTAYPVTFTVTPTGRQGDMRLEVSAVQELESERIVRARGTATVAIEPGQRSDVRVMLEPDDFVVNSTVAGDQLTTLMPGGHGGRNIATAADGSFLVGFASECDPGCDVRARWFGADARPGRIGDAPDSGDFLVAQAGDADPAVSTATHQDRMALAWVAARSTPPGTEIRAAVLTASGVIADDLPVATGDLVAPVGPAQIAFLGSGELLVTWLQGGGDPMVRGRLLDSDGVPAINPVTGDDGAFDIGAAAPGAAPAVAATGQGRGFVTTWSDGGNLLARFFGPDGVPRSDGPIELTGYAGGVVEGGRVTWDGRAAVVTWSAAVAEDPTLAQGALLVGRFLPPDGTPQGEPVVLVADTAGNTGVPDVAVHADGTMAAVWHGCGAAGDGAGCGVFMQLVDPAGALAGAPFVVATTTAGDQEDPAVAATGEAFVVVWTDRSAASPDPLGSAVRARVVYPSVRGLMPSAFIFL